MNNLEKFCTLRKSINLWRQSHSQHYKDFFWFKCYLPIVLISLTMPLLRSKTDMWDGTVITFAIESKDYSGLNDWLFGQGWELQYFLVRLQSQISETSGVSFDALNTFLVSTALLNVAIQSEFIAEKVFTMQKFWSRVSGIFSILFPVWHNLLSSVLVFHICALSLGLLGVRLLTETGKLRVLLGFMFCLLSFNLQSLLILLPALLLFAHKELNQRYGNRISSLKVFIVLTSSALFFVLKRYLDPNEGTYDGYHQIMNPFSSELVTIIISQLYFTSYLLVPGFAFTICVLLNSIVSKCRASESQILLEDPLNFKIVQLFILCFVSALPYVLVGRISKLGSWDWDGRQAFTISVPVSILTSAIMARILINLGTSNLLRKKRFTQIRIINVTIVALALYCISFSGFAVKIQRQNLERDIFKVLHSNPELKLGGAVQLILSQKPVPVHRTYEANYLFYKQYGSTDKWVRISAKYDQGFEAPQGFQDKTQSALSLFSGVIKPCKTNIWLNTKGYQGVVSSTLNFYGFGKNKSVKLVRIIHHCKA